MAAREMKREPKNAPFFARSLTLVPRSLLLNRTETLATQARHGMPLIFLFRFLFFLFLRREKYSWHKERWVGEFISPLDCVIFLQLFTNVVVPWFCFVLFHVFRDMVDHAKFSR